MEERQEKHISHQVENPGVVLVNALLTGNNFLPWSKAIKRALIAKEKHMLINDKVKRDEKVVDFVRWENNDCLVTS